MIIKRIHLKNFTVFEDHKIEFVPGIDVFTGTNGTGKIHLLKVLYSACQSVSPKTAFAHKLVLTMLPDDYRISRLVTRKPGSHQALIRIVASAPDRSQERIITASFHGSTKKWEAEVTGEDGWEGSYAGLSSIFIPAKEILSHSYNLNAAAEKNNVVFDDTCQDILNAAKVDISTESSTSSKDALLRKIQQITHGKVQYDIKQDEFYLINGRSRLEFNLVAEGIRKLSLLWQLVKNGTLEKGSILFWDEPEANICPTHIPIITEILLELQRHGVQVFLATHDYLTASYFDVKKTPSDNVVYHSLSIEYSTGILQYEKADKFADLKNNAIIDAYNRLLDVIYDL